MNKKDKKFFDGVDSNVDLPKLEDKIVDFWKKNKIFEKSISKNSESKNWTFLDGPPFITGMPHYGTLLSSIPKDIFPRYWTMKGYRVRRVWGWDCHGLPAENKVENKLGIKRKREIETKIGVGKFIDECKSYVSQVSSDWEWYVDHIGRWVDFGNAYKTMDKSYMESVMWVFKSMYDKGYIYKGRRISLYCPHCSTPISNFEVAMDPDNYENVTEPSNTYKYELKNFGDKKRTYILAWSTTPWTKITTTALAINPKFDYVKVEHNNEYYILAKNTLERVFKDKKYKSIGVFPGTKLEGIEYVAHYDYFRREKDKKIFIIVGGNFVTDDEGTGVVTIAPYGEEDLKIMEEKNIQIVLHVDEEGKFFKDVPNWGGLFYEKANPLINKDLSDRGLMFDETLITHSVPTCWRCHSRLIYVPQDAWYVDIQKLKHRLFKNNKNVNWYPKHFKYGRFKKSMEAAPDWCISRSRYWGSPVPVWECECGERYVFGSIEELEKASGKKIKDLHKPDIDKITVKCNKCGKQAHRVNEVLDSWIEAGSASFAERHFPFNKTFKLKDFFPPDFIVEYTGQIRAWFYVLHVISTALFDSNAFKNVLVTGVILGTDGRKMSKNFGNYPDPRKMLETYGADALRLYLMSTPVMKGEDVAMNESQFRDWVRSYLLTLWNVYNYFVTYTNINDWRPSGKDTLKFSSKKSILDRWIVLRLRNLTNIVTESLESYDTVSYIEHLKDFVEDLSTWYLRRSRERDDKNNFFLTMYKVLCTFSKLSAPITPFISEVIYKNLTKEESVHLTTWPEKNTEQEEDGLLEDMKTVRKIVEKGHSFRKEFGIPTRQPLSRFFVKENRLKESGLEKLILDELNVKSIKYGQKEYKLDTKITPELEEEAKTRELIRKVQNERKNLNVSLDDKIIVVSDWLPENSNNLKRLREKTLAQKFKKGGFSVKKI